MVPYIKMYRVNISKYSESLNSRKLFNERRTYNTTQPNTLLNLLYRGYRIGELSVQINPSNSRACAKLT